MRVPLVLISLCLALVALADDFKTAEGKEYKNATVLCVRPDGIDIKTRSGMAKLYFSELLTRSGGTLSFRLTVVWAIPGWGE